MLTPRPSLFSGTHVPNKQCPNCWQTNVYDTVRYLDPKTNANITEVQRSSTFWGALACLLAILALNVCLPYLFGSDSAIAQALPLWLPVPLGLAVGIIMRVINQRKLDASVRVHNYRCDNCGHRWQMEEKGSP